LFFRVDDFDLADSKGHAYGHIGRRGATREIRTPQTKEFSLRDPDGYYGYRISALSAALQGAASGRALAGLHGAAPPTSLPPQGALGRLIAHSNRERK